MVAQTDNENGAKRTDNLRSNGKVRLGSLLSRKVNGRGGEIRTHDLLYPKQARYQATLRPDPRAEEGAGT
jgi:hypothetical protein